MALVEIGNTSGDPSFSLGQLLWLWMFLRRGSSLRNLFSHPLLVLWLSPIFHLLHVFLLFDSFLRCERFLIRLFRSRLLWWVICLGRQISEAYRYNIVGKIFFSRFLFLWPSLVSTFSYSSTCGRFVPCAAIFLLSSSSRYCLSPCEVPYNIPYPPCYYKRV